jgi:hypothetical protein
LWITSVPIAKGATTPPSPKQSSLFNLDCHVN